METGGNHEKDHPAPLDKLGEKFYTMRVKISYHFRPLNNAGLFTLHKIGCSVYSLVNPETIEKMTRFFGEFRTGPIWKCWGFGS